ncbi:MAG TPA: fused MFS/spermidine synthase, partial [Hyphomicrobiaceae bacterium]|nr:fused MFS/spermidine synthase [Hyphomicrobiaceae bacterium]
TYVTTDIASAPLLWVLPLAAFLLTFILVFRERPVLPHSIMLQLQPALVGAFLLGISSPGQPWRTIAAIAAIGGAFVTTIVAHRELYERRPDPLHLTEFYLWMSVGGVLGGVFSALIAPQIFASMWEMPLLMALGLACRPTVAGPAVSRNRTLLLMGLGLVMVALASMAFRDGWLKPDNTLVRPGIMVVFIGLVLLSQQAWRQLCLTAVPLAAMAFLPSALNRGDAERSFFGVHRVFESPDGQMRVLMHGTTIHGAERLRDGDGKPVSAALPSTYYYPGGPLAQGVEAARQSTNKPAGGLAVGVVGLGTGSMACHSRSNERWRFYEIDPVVMKIARDPSRFTFLSRCRPDAEFVLGDARLTLGKAPASGYDYLVVDAFSSDAVPVHLLTVEALGLYLSKLSPNGLLALHVSNRHLDLIGVTAALVQALPGIHGVFASDAVPGDALDATSSQVVFIAKSATALAPLQSRVRVAALPKTNAAPWTDDFSDIVTAVRRRR